MHEPIQCRGHWIPEHPLQELVAQVPRSQAVAVRDPEPPALDRAGEDAVHDLEPELVPEEGQRPEVMVAADEGDRKPGPPERLEPGDHPEAAARNGPPVGEPEVE